MANDNMKHRRLQELDESDFEIVDGQPDIRGWDVKNEAGETIGEVDELILDAQKRKVRYMVVDLDDDALDLDNDRRVLIPIGIAQLHEKEDDVLLPNITAAQLLQLPVYDKDHLDDEAERAVCTALGRSTVAATGQESTDFYQHDHFNENNLYQRRLPQRTAAGDALEENSFRFRDRNLSGSSGLQGGLGREGLNETRRHNRQEIEEDSLLSVNRDRSDSAIDRLSGSLDDDRSDSPVERDIERRNREGSRDNNDLVM